VCVCAACVVVCACVFLSVCVYMCVRVYWYAYLCVSRCVRVRVVVCVVRAVVVHDAVLQYCGCR
jgi:hypothetical protein